MKGLFKSKPRTPADLVRQTRDLLFYTDRSNSLPDLRESKREEKMAELSRMTVEPKWACLGLMYLEEQNRILLVRGRISFVRFQIYSSSIPSLNLRFFQILSGAANSPGVEARGFIFGYTVRAGVEARGFIFGPPIALAIGAKFVPMRKPKKLPGKVISEEYSLEYGTDKIEMHVGAVEPGERAIIIDDLSATGGTLSAAIRLADARGSTCQGWNRPSGGNS